MEIEFLVTAGNFALLASVCTVAKSRGYILSEGKELSISMIVRPSPTKRCSAVCSVLLSCQRVEIQVKTSYAESNGAVGTLIVARQSP